MIKWNTRNLSDRVFYVVQRQATTLFTAKRDTLSIFGAFFMAPLWPLLLAGLLPVTASAELAQTLLQAHNTVRADVNAPPLVWSKRAEAQAAGWARELSQGCDIEHSQGSGFGENLFMGTLGYYDALDGVKSWENEKRYYSGQPLTRALVPRVGHYTQMIWPDTRELGCATSTCNDMMILVCNYYPPGNYLGEAAW